MGSARIVLISLRDFTWCLALRVPAAYLSPLYLIDISWEHRLNMAKSMLYWIYVIYLWFQRKLFNAQIRKCAIVDVPWAPAGSPAKTGRSDAAGLCDPFEVLIYYHSPCGNFDASWSDDNSCPSTDFECRQLRNSFIRSDQDASISNVRSCAKQSFCFRGRLWAAGMMRIENTSVSQAFAVGVWAGASWEESTW